MTAKLWNLLDDQRAAVLKLTAWLRENRRTYTAGDAWHTARV